MVMVNQIIHLGVGIGDSQKLVCSRAINEFNSFIAGRSMEDPFQQKRKESQYKDQNEEQG